MSIDTRLYFIKDKAKLDDQYSTEDNPFENPLALAEVMKDMARGFNTNILKEIIDEPLVSTEILEDTLNYALNAGIFPKAEYGMGFFNHEIKKGSAEKSLCYVQQPLVLLDDSTATRCDTIESAFALISRYGVNQLLNTNVDPNINYSQDKMRVVKLEKALFEMGIGSSYFLSNYKNSNVDQFDPSKGRVLHCHSGESVTNGFVENNVLKDKPTYDRFTKMFTVCMVSLQRNVQSNAFFEYIKDADPFKSLILYEKEDISGHLSNLSEPCNADVKDFFEAFNALENKGKVTPRIK